MRMSDQLEPIDTADTVIKSILTGEYDQQLAQIRSAVMERKERIDLTRGRSLRIGDRVRIISGRPRYFIGSIATVTDVMQTYIRIKIDKDVGRFSAGADIRCPMAVVEKV
jgi:hypothetical protein